MDARNCFAALLFGASLVVGDLALAADLPARAPVFAAPEPIVSEWSFRFTPYGWAPSMNGTQTIRGRSAKVDASFIEVLEKSDSLLGLMADAEIRNGPRRHRRECRVE
jgi:hypothetical protein